MAEGAARALASERGLDVEVDSAGTGGWHAGDAPDHRATKTAARHGVDITALRARQLVLADFDRFDFIAAMDEENLVYARAMQPEGSRAHVALLLSHCGRTDAEVGDPYYGGADNFEGCWQDIQAGVDGLLTAIAERI